MIYTDLTETAMKIAFEAHRNQKDKAGLPYFHHPMHIADKFDDEKLIATALLHDVVEDTEITFDDLRAQNIPDDVICALKLLTHDKNTSYDDYIKNIQSNEIARQVKIEDLRHNLDTTRMRNVDSDDMSKEKTKKRIAKYRKSLAYLLNK